jgi:hypothetical protein
MSWKLLQPLAAAVALGAVLLTLVSCRRCRLLFSGEVKDLDGRPIRGCTVELLIQRHFLHAWTVYAAKEATTDSEGAFSFGVLWLPWTRYRLRAAHPGYQEWVLDAPLSGAPRRVQVTLLRAGESLAGVVPTRG